MRRDESQLALWIQLTAGGLFALLSGGCAFYVLLQGAEWETQEFHFFFALPPVIIGLIVAVPAGRELMRRRRGKQTDPLTLDSGTFCSLFPLLPIRRERGGLGQ